MKNKTSVVYPNISLDILPVAHNKDMLIPIHLDNLDISSESDDKLEMVLIHH